MRILPRVPWPALSLQTDIHTFSFRPLKLLLPCGWRSLSCLLPSASPCPALNFLFLSCMSSFNAGFLFSYKGLSPLSGDRAGWHGYPYINSIVTKLKYVFSFIVTLRFLDKTLHIFNSEKKLVYYQSGCTSLSLEVYIWVCLMDETANNRKLSETWKCMYERTPLGSGYVAALAAGLWMTWVWTILICGLGAGCKALRG